MKSALELAWRGDGLFPRGLRFDIHDNFKDIGSNQGEIGSSQSAAEGGTNAISSASGPISASDNAVVQNSGNTSVVNNVLDAGAIAAAEQIAVSGLTMDQSAFQAANETVQDALDKNTALASQTQQGEVTTWTKSLGWIAAGLFGIWALYKVIVAFFGGKKATA